jgi:hypothetical protein
LCYEAPLMASAFRSVAALAVASALAVLSAPGCSQQGEGERCDRVQANQTSSDCDSGLTCVARSELLEDLTDLCCPPEGQETNQRCTRKGGSTTTGGTSSGGTAGTGGSSDSAGESAGGSSAGTTSEDGGTSGSGGVPPEAGAGGAPMGEAGAPGVGGAPSAGAPNVTAGQGGAD